MDAADSPVVPGAQGEAVPFTVNPVQKRVVALDMELRVEGAEVIDVHDVGERELDDAVMEFDAAPAVGVVDPALQRAQTFQPPTRLVKDMVVRIVFARLVFRIAEYYPERLSRFMSGGHGTITAETDGAGSGIATFTGCPSGPNVYCVPSGLP